MGEFTWDRRGKPDSRVTPKAYETPTRAKVEQARWDYLTLAEPNPHKLDPNKLRQLGDTMRLMARSAIRPAIASCYTEAALGFLARGDQDAAKAMVKAARTDMKASTEISKRPRHDRGPAAADINQARAKLFQASLPFYSAYANGEDPVRYARKDVYARTMQDVALPFADRLESKELNDNDRNHIRGMLAQVGITQLLNRGKMQPDSIAVTSTERQGSGGKVVENGAPKSSAFDIALYRGTELIPLEVKADEKAVEASKVPYMSKTLVVQADKYLGDDIAATVRQMNDELTSLADFSKDAKAALDARQARLWETVEAHIDENGTA